MQQNNLAPGRAYHAIEQFGTWQDLPCNKSECLYPSALISNSVPGRAYHAFCILSEFSFPFLVPGRAYHASYVSF